MTRRKRRQSEEIVGGGGGKINTSKERAQEGKRRTKKYEKYKRKGKGRTKHSLSKTER